MKRDEVRRRVLAAVAEGKIPKGSPSELAALGIIDQMPSSYWEQWSRGSIERTRAHTRARAERAQQREER
jgi:hypothetical protein